MFSICRDCGGRSYGSEDGPIGYGYSNIRYCECSRQDSNDEFEFETGPVGGMSPQRAHELRRARLMSERQAPSFQPRSRSYPQYQAPRFQSRLNTADTVPLALGIGIGVIIGVVICLGFLIIF
jgi:hypothetical protein